VHVPGPALGDEEGDEGAALLADESEAFVVEVLEVFEAGVAQVLLGEVQLVSARVP